MDWWRNNTQAMRERRSLREQIERRDAAAIRRAVQSVCRRAARYRAATMPVGSLVRATA